ncbi:tRNA (adenosine(37)-N6)-threonylcarbamoyltransferase complex transferase subunit TsaD [Candidatus Saccharibacteria bacterium]|nr:tRNA (adenosine(37)-N6)-threonylcarbamoyltransferase complex transferase subunit TsaD [Candidatus Saccharibacteria bacterium]
MKILGIETSCDETAAAVVENGPRVISNVIASQIDLHKSFGGVVPEIAARSHLESINVVINEAVERAGGWDSIDAIAVTSQPGLIGALMIGTLAARTLAIVYKKPLISVHHIKGHIYANFLELENEQSPQKIDFPILSLVVSGGHTQILFQSSHSDFEIISSTRDDAVGEVFDKVARILGLPYPGGPEISKIASEYHGEIISLPIAKLKPDPAKPFDGQLDFSFSGLKTAVLRTAQNLAGVGIDYPSFELADKLTHEQKALLAKSFEQTAVRTLARNMKTAQEKLGARTIMLAGGVAANRALREEIQKTFSPANKVSAAGSIPGSPRSRGGLVAKEDSFRLKRMPPLKYCTDNAAMIASASFFQTKENQPYANPLDFSILPRSSIS